MGTKWGNEPKQGQIKGKMDTKWAGEKDAMHTYILASFFNEHQITF